MSDDGAEAPALRAGGGASRGPPGDAFPGPGSPLSYSPQVRPRAGPSAENSGFECLGS